MKKEKENYGKYLGYKAVKNMFFVYLFTAAVTGRYEIFSAICSSFPFVLPVIFCDSTMDFYKRVGRSLLYGFVGCVAAVLFMLAVASYSLTAWLVPGMYGFVMCVGYSLVQKRLSEHKRTVMKCIISVSVCFLAFV